MRSKAVRFILNITLCSSDEVGAEQIVGEVDTEKELFELVDRSIKRHSGTRRVTLTWEYKP